MPGSGLLMIGWLGILVGQVGRYANGILLGILGSMAWTRRAPRRWRWSGLPLPAYPGERRAPAAGSR